MRENTEPFILCNRVVTEKPKIFPEIQNNFSTREPEDWANILVVNMVFQRERPRRTSRPSRSTPLQPELLLHADELQGRWPSARLLPVGQRAETTAKDSSLKRPCIEQLVDVFVGLPGM